MSGVTEQERAEWRKEAEEEVGRGFGYAPLDARTLALLDALEAVEAERDEAARTCCACHTVASMRAEAAEAEREALLSVHEVNKTLLTTIGRADRDRKDAEAEVARLTQTVAELEAALEQGDACGAVGCRALAERDRLAATVERVEALAEEARKWVVFADASPDIDVFGDAWMHTTILRGLAAIGGDR